MFVQIKSRKIVLSLLVFITLLVLIVPVAWGENPKSIMLFIGDGMATNQRMITEKVFGKKLYMNTLPVTGIYSTDAANTVVTDSAAAGTDIAKKMAALWGITLGSKPIVRKSRKKK